MGIRKDQILDWLAQRGNVAQFVAFEPTLTGPRSTFSRLVDHAPNDAPTSLGDAVRVLLAASPERSVNVRSYSPEDPQSREFVYGLTDPTAALANVERLIAQGLHVIVNETINVTDGGVSGVMQGSIIEFAPDDTPRCVERPGTAAMEAVTGLRLLEAVYGFKPDLTPTAGVRTEFSIHPQPRGWRHSHTLLWEREEGLIEPTPQAPRWPNAFSRMIGDKAFGLLIAAEAGVPVPKTLVIGRRIAPFVFGVPTGSNELWTRTCPRDPQPGLYTTVKGWTDPFALLAREDVGADTIASVLRQDAVQAQHSGAAIVAADGTLIIEGRPGEGDRLMLGADLPEPLPPITVERIHDTFAHLSKRLGPVRFEWVDDGEQLWVVQLHVGATGTLGRTVVEGEVERWATFEARLGLNALRATLATLPSGVGLVVTGGAGLTSHVADVLRKAGRPSYLDS